MSSADTTRALTIKHTYSKVVGWAGLAFCLFLTVSAWRAADLFLFLVSLGFLAMSCYVILTTGSMEVDSDSVRYYLPLRSYQIKWTDVKYIEVDRNGASMVFVGENKKLSVNGPKLWTGNDKLDMAELIGTQIDSHGIEIRPTEKAMFRLSRNTKVGA